MEAPTKRPKKERKSAEELEEEIERTKKLLAMSRDELIELLRGGTLSEEEVAVVESRVERLRERDHKKVQQMSTRLLNGRPEEEE